MNESRDPDEGMTLSEVIEESQCGSEAKGYDEGYDAGLEAAARLVDKDYSWVATVQADLAAAIRAMKGKP